MIINQQDLDKIQSAVLCVAYLYLMIYIMKN